MGRFPTINIDGRLFDPNVDGARMPWDYMPEWDFSRMWYERFLIYRELTPEKRHVKGAWQVFVEKQSAAGRIYRRQCASTSWQNHSRAGFWKERAAAWDDFLRWSQEREKLAVNRDRLRQTQERDWTEATEVRDRVKEALRLVTLVITQKEYVAERWEPGEVAVPGEPKRIVVPVKLRVSPAELARSMMILSDLQRRGAGVGPWGELPDLVAAEQAVPLDAEDRPMTWSAHVLSMKIGELSEELVNARMEIERRDAEIARLKAKAGEV